MDELLVKVACYLLLVLGEGALCMDELLVRWAGVFTCLVGRFGCWLGWAPGASGSVAATVECYTRGPRQHAS